MALKTKRPLYCQVDSKIMTDAKILAAKRHIDLQDVVEDALRQYLTKEKK